jgi:hypothetical protein
MPLDGAGFDPVVQTLRIAESIIGRRGWVQRSFGDDTSPRCVVGAIQEASITVAAISGLDLYKLRWDVGYLYGTANGIDCIQVWQDRPERTLDDVLAGFGRAIDRAIKVRVAA